MDRNPEDEERIRQLKERYKKNVDNFVNSPAEEAEGSDQIESENRSNNSDRIKLLLKYSAVFLGFFGTLAIIVYILDAFVIPSYIHNKKIVEVPDLIGMDHTEASEMLLSMGLISEENGAQFDPNYKEGQVILQTPEAGLNVKSGRNIYLTISKGKEKAKVPYMIGMSSREAMVQLVSRGLVMGKISYENSEMFDRDIVLSQSTENGKFISLGDTIRLVVSKGSELTIYTPDIVGMDINIAREIIENNNLVIGNITYQIDETFNEGTILGQYPRSGDETLEGTFIDLIVAQSPENSSMEELPN